MGQTIYWYERNKGHQVEKVFDTNFNELKSMRSRDLYKGLDVTNISQTRLPIIIAGGSFR